MNPNPQRASFRVATAALLLWILLPVALMQMGCQSIEATTMVGSVEQAGRTSEDAGEAKLFLELVTPEPAWIQKDQSRRDQLLATNYQEDLRRGFIAFVVPISFRLDLEDFQRDPGQEKASAPYLVLQLRERRIITVQKKHQVTKRGLFARKADIALEQVPVWSFWRPAAPEDAGERTEEITIQLPEELETPGLFATVRGPVDAQGRLRVSLAPWLSQAARRGRDLRLQVTCPAKQLSIEVTVSREVLLHHKGVGPQGGP